MLTKARHRWTDSVRARTAAAAAIVSLVVLCALAAAVNAQAADPIAQTVTAVQASTNLPRGVADAPAAADPGATPPTPGATPTTPAPIEQTPSVPAPRTQILSVSAKAPPLPTPSSAIRHSTQTTEASLNRTAATAETVAASAGAIERSTIAVARGADSKGAALPVAVKAAATGATAALRRTVPVADSTKSASRALNALSAAVERNLASVVHSATPGVSAPIAAAEPAGGLAATGPTGSRPHETAVCAQNTLALNVASDGSCTSVIGEPLTPIQPQDIAASWRAVSSSTPSSSRSRAAGHAPVAPQTPEQPPVGTGAPAGAAPAGFGLSILLSLLGLLMLGLPRAMRRLGLASESLRTAPFVLISDRPG